MSTFGLVSESHRKLRNECMIYSRVLLITPSMTGKVFHHSVYYIFVFFLSFFFFITLFSYFVYFIFPLFLFFEKRWMNSQKMYKSLILYVQYWELNS